MGWKVKCRVCGTERVIRISFDISKQPAIFYYCNVCRRNLQYSRYLRGL